MFIPLFFIRLFTINNEEISHYIENLLVNSRYDHLRDAQNTDIGVCHSRADGVDKFLSRISSCFGKDQSSRPEILTNFNRSRKVCRNLLCSVQIFVLRLARNPEFQAIAPRIKEIDFNEFLSPDTFGRVQKGEAVALYTSYSLQHIAQVTHYVDSILADEMRDLVHDVRIIRKDFPFSSQMKIL